MRRPAREVLNAGVAHAACGFVVYAGYDPACRFHFLYIRLVFFPLSISPESHSGHPSLHLFFVMCAERQTRDRLGPRQGATAPPPFVMSSLRHIVMTIFQKNLSFICIYQNFFVPLQPKIYAGGKCLFI